MLQLNDITKNNWYDVVCLKVREDQVSFVASNAVSLAQLNFLDNFKAKALYDDEQLVGFTLYGIDEDDNEYWIYRLMIDQKFQGKGYGKEAIKLIIEDISLNKQPQHSKIMISYEPSNTHAKLVYEKMGFKEVDGLLIGGEQVATYSFE